MYDCLRFLGAYDVVLDIDGRFLDLLSRFEKRKQFDSINMMRTISIDDASVWFSLYLPLLIYMFVFVVCLLRDC